MKLLPIQPILRPGTLSIRSSPREGLPFPLNHPRCQLWYLGRNAIYAAIGSLGLRPGETALVPSYTSGVEVAALDARGLVVRTVRLCPDMSIDLEDLEQKLRATGARLVLAIHYLGFPQPIDDILRICRAYGAFLFEDGALSLLARFPDGRPVGSVGDCACFCLYKSLPVRDGAALVINNPSVPMPDPPVSPRLASSLSGVGCLMLSSAQSGGIVAQGAAVGLGLARRVAVASFRYARVARVPLGGMRFDGRFLSWGASRFTKAILPRLDYEALWTARRRNFLRLRERMDRVPTLFQTLPEGACPLFYPVIVEDKLNFMRELSIRGIESINFWSTWHPTTPPDEHPEIAWLRRHVVELPCHPDLDEQGLDYIADCARRALGWRRVTGRRYLPLLGSMPIAAASAADRQST